MIEQSVKNNSKSMNTHKLSTHTTRQDELNNWNFCNPSLKEDKLPQPYRFIDKCLNQEILREVYEKVFEIEKYKNDPNYEGSLKEFQFSGYFDIEMISVISQDRNQKQNMSLIGDKLGNVILLDLDKKIKVNKLQVQPNKQVVDIQSTSFEYKEGTLITFAVILKGDSNVYIYRFLWEEKKIFLHYTIDLVQKNNQQEDPKQTKGKKEQQPQQQSQDGDLANVDIGEYPYSCLISDEAKYIVINQYNGNSVVYEINEPPQKEVQQQQNAVKTDEHKDSLEVESVLDIKTQKITQELLKISCHLPIKQKTSKQIMQSYVDSLPEHHVVQEQVQNTQNAKTKDPKQANKTVNQTVITSPNNPVEPQIEYESNKVQYLGQQEYEKPKYRADVYFVQQEVIVQDEKKSFRQPQNIKMTVQLVLVWKNSKKFQIYQLQKHCVANCPAYLMNMNNQSQNEMQSEVSFTLSSNVSNKTAKMNAKKEAEEQKKMQEQIKQQMEVEERKLMKIQPYLKFEADTIYDIVQSNISLNQLLLAIGMVDGTILVWDLQLNSEKFFLDKHQKLIFGLKFLEDSYLISSSYDGYVHIYNMIEGNVMMKRTNLFRQSDYHIVGMEVSEMGLAMVLDSKGNGRCYDITHGEKVFKYTANSQIDNLDRSFQLNPALVSAKNDQICVVGSYNNDCNKTTILIYKTFENLINLYPGLSNLYRKGIERSKICNIFPKLGMQELRNKELEIQMSFDKTQQMKDNNRSSKQSILKTSQRSQKSRLTSEKSFSTIDMNSSYQSKLQKTVTINNKWAQSQKAGQQQLTYEALNREKEYYQKQNQSISLLYDIDKQTIQKQHELSRKKIARQKNVNRAMNRIENELRLQDEKKHLEMRQKMLQQIDQK